MDWIDRGGKGPLSLKTPGFTVTYSPNQQGDQPVAPEGRAPVIGISGSSDSSKSVIAAMTQIRSAGGVPVFLGNHSKRIHDTGELKQALINDLSHVDGLMVLGNDGDIDPAKYGAAKDPHTKVETDKARADYEEAAIQSAMEVGMPVLGICGGMQRINVLGGGTLHQHVPDIVGDNHHMQGDSDIPGFVPVQVVKFTDGSMMKDIAGDTHSVYTPTHQELPPGVVMENSFHHQAVKDVRPDFRVSAISSDGIIEGIEPKPDGKYGKQFVLGVQWHPEFGASEVGPKIAKNFLSAAKAYAVTKPQEASFDPQAQPGQVYDVHTNVPASPPLPQLLMMNPSMIHTDPATYQFRAHCDEKGLTGEHRLKAERWDPILQGEPLLVHQRKNGEYYVVDGHHRLDLAMRSNAAGQGPENVAVQVLREADGYTAQDAKIIAAYKNLQHHLNRNNAGNTELVDGARAFREARTVAHPEWLPSLQMDSSDMHVSYKLAQMSDYAFDAVNQGKVPARSAAIVAESLPDQAQQDRAIQLITEQLAKRNYDVTMRSGGEAAQSGIVIPFVAQQTQDVAAQQDSQESLPVRGGFVDKLMAQRSAQASAMAR